MENVLPILIVLACPLGMALMGAGAWVGGKLLHRRDEADG
jgi:hypothetical protein